MSINKLMVKYSIHTLTFSFNELIFKSHKNNYFVILFLIEFRLLEYRF